MATLEHGKCKIKYALVTKLWHRDVAGMRTGCPSYHKTRTQLLSKQENPHTHVVGPRLGSHENWGIEL